MGGRLVVGLALYISVYFVALYHTIPLCHPTLG